MLASAFAYRSRCSPAPAKVGRRIVVHPRIVERLQASRIVGRAGWKRLYPPEPEPEPEPEFDINTVAPIVTVIASYIFLLMSFKADIMPLREVINMPLSGSTARLDSKLDSKLDCSSLKDDIKRLSDKVDLLSEKYNELKARNAGLERLVDHLQTKVNIALEGRIAGRDL